MIKISWITSFLLFSMASAYSQSSVQSPHSKDFIFNNLDRSIKPGDDFFSFANGGWIKKNPIPVTESSWGIGNLIIDTIRNKLLIVNKQAAQSHAAPGTDLQKIGDFYSTAMDSAKVDALGIQPLQPYLNAIDSIQDLRGIWTMAAKMSSIGSGTFFAFHVGQDDKNSKKNQVFLSQGGLGLPNRDYYFSKLARFQTIRNAYAPHIDRMLVFAGYPQLDATREAAQIFKFETALAGASRPLQDLRDPYANYHKLDIKALQGLMPSVDWPSWFKTTGLAGVDTVIVRQPEFLQALEKQVKLVPLDVLKSYLKWNLVTDYSSALPTPVNTENFHFYGTLINGQTLQKPRWKRVIDEENRYMGMLLGKLFIKAYFSHAAKLRYTKMVNDVLAAYRDRIRGLDWMSDTTKRKALVKLSSVTYKIGYPDKWLDYSTMDISTGSYFSNLVEAKKWRHRDIITQYRKPVDRSRWGMFPQTYNAYYNPSNNEIVLPAAMMAVPGLRDEEIDDAVAYGYTAGSTIGHEITHGFDDEGRQYDEKGNLRSWWTKGDEGRFNKKAKVLADQFDHYVVLDSMHVNGKACLGENMADLGGILLGMQAFKKTAQYHQGQKINGLTPPQRYFLGYAMGWLVEERNESLARQILSDVHAPANFRVNGPLSDDADFYEAFQVKPGDAMFRKVTERAQVW